MRSASQGSVWEAVVAFILLFLFMCAAAECQSYDVRMIPVGWSDATAPTTQAGALGICSQAASDWLGLSKGKIVLNCTAEPVRTFAQTFSAQGMGCFGDYTNAINEHVDWPVYVRGVPGCPMYNANLGRPGAWIQGLLTHEFGHNLGLNHTGSVDCYYNFFDPDPAGPCTFNGYAQGFDVMGTGAGLNAPHAGYLQVPPLVVGLSRQTQTVDVGPAPVRFPRGDGGLTYWVELYGGSIYVEYTGAIGFSTVDVMVCAVLAVGGTFNDPYGGISITRTGNTFVSVVVSQPVPKPTPLPPGSPTPTIPATRCYFGFTQISCTPTQTATVLAPTSTPTVTPSPERTVIPPAPRETVTPTDTVPPTVTATATAIPTPKPKPPAGGCGHNQAAILLWLPVLGLVGRRYYASKSS